jgi:hypothetical protein
MSKICIPIPSSSVIGVSTAVASTPSINIMRVEPSITGLTGGGVNNLDGLITVSGSYAVGICIFLVIGGIPAIYQLVNGVAVETPPSIILPNDYDGITNTKHWIQRM